RLTWPLPAWITRCGGTRTDGSMTGFCTCRRALGLAEGVGSPADDSLAWTDVYWPRWRRRGLYAYLLGWYPMKSHVKAIVEELGPVLLITLNRPEMLNAVDGELSDQLGSALTRLEES